MQKPAFPPTEPRRIAALKQLNMLDTPREERFDRFTRLAKKLFNTDIALVSLVDSDRQWFKSKQGLAASETPRNISFCGHAILQERVFIVEDAASDPRFYDNPLVTDDPKIRFYAGCPLHGPDGERVGTLCVIDSAPRTFNQEDESLLSDVAAMVELDLASIAMATTDELTGLSNRRGMRQIAKHAIAQAQRTRSPLSAVYFDLDKFKPINDTYGHAAGDDVLKRFADLLLRAFRECDIVARLGGDEFCVLLSGVGEVGTSQALSRLRKLVAESNASSGEPYTVSFSAGIAAVPGEELSGLDELLRQADEAMYVEKKRRSVSAAAA